LKGAMMEYTDEEIMAMAKGAGFWGGVEWRSHTAPYFRKFLELATRETGTDKECHCDNPEWMIGPCLKCGGLIPL